MKNRRWKVIIFPGILVILSLLIYSNTLLNGFTFDDFREIVNTPLVTRFSGEEFLEAFTPGPNKPEPPGRPIPLLTFTLNYTIGGLNPLGYHLVNLILYAAGSLFIYLVCLELFPGKTRFSFLTAALFACHPIHSDVVAAATGRSELISSLCYLAVLLIYLRTTGSDYAKRSGSYWLTLPILFIGTLSKGTSSTLPFTVMAFDLYRFTIREKKSLAHALSVFTYRLKKFYLYYILIFLATRVVYSAMPAKDELGANFMVFLSSGERILAGIGILARYIFLLVWPLRLSVDYSYRQLAYLPESLQLLWIGGGIISIIAGIGLAWISLRNKGLYFLGLFIFAVNYLIISNIIIVINVSMAERLIYMASWGFCLMLGILLESGFTRAGRTGRGLLWTIVVLILTAYSIRTWTRNRDWLDNFTLFKSAYRVSPMSCRVNYNLGLDYSERGDIEKAIFHYEKASLILPEHPLYHLNLGEAYIQRGEPDKAIKEFKEAIRLAPERTGGYINLGSAYTGKGLADQAIQSLMIARRLDPDDWRIYFNLGDAFRVKDDYEQAAWEYMKSVELHPDHWEAWNKLGAMNIRLNHFQDAIDNFRQAIAYSPESREAYNNLGITYAILGDNEEAEKVFRRALEIDNDFMKARDNLMRLINSHKAP